MKDATLADWTKLAKCATEMKSARDIIKQKADRAETRAKRDSLAKPTATSEPAAAKATSPPIQWRVKHAPAKTVYTIQCHSTLTLTVGFGDPIHPDDADFVARAERRDVPEHWALWGSLEDGPKWVQSTHDSKDEARAALRANRLAPPEPPPPLVLDSKFTTIDSSIGASATRH
jgi:hypothetical protein